MSKMLFEYTTLKLDKLCEILKRRGIRVMLEEEVWEYYLGMSAYAEDIGIFRHKLTKEDKDGYHDWVETMSENWVCIMTNPIVYVRRDAWFSIKEKIDEEEDKEGN